jgi:trimeric autotransporter adhesin
VKRSLIVCISALIFPAGGAFAQNIANLPGFVSPGNTAEIEQIGSNNKVQSAGGAAGLDQTVNSSNSGNWAGIYQGHLDNGTAYATAGSTASVAQTASAGARNLSPTLQFGTNQTSSVTQNNTGAGQYLAWVQQGVKNDVPSINPSSIGNQATILQQVTANGRYVTFPVPGEPSMLVDRSTIVAGAGITQLGQDSVASITQRSPAAFASIRQNGNGDGSTVNASITQDGQAANNAQVWQDGNYGRVTVTQDGLAGVTNVSYVNQYSSNSYVSVDQKGAAGINTSTVTQNAGLGFDKATVIQDAQGSYSNTSTITQQDGSSAWVDQQSAHGANTATINQSGAGNSANVRQR